jgi:hypothetical protein
MQGMPSNQQSICKLFTLLTSHSVEDVVRGLCFVLVLHQSTTSTKPTQELSGGADCAHNATRTLALRPP